MLKGCEGAEGIKGLFFLSWVEPSLGGAGSCLLCVWSWASSRAGALQGSVSLREAGSASLHRLQGSSGARAEAVRPLGAETWTRPIAPHLW